MRAYVAALTRHVRPGSVVVDLNPHVHAVFLDGAYRDKGDSLDFRAVGHLSTRDVAAVLERTRDRMVKWLRRRGLLLDLSLIHISEPTRPY